jgi:hypothetical protein
MPMRWSRRRLIALRAWSEGGCRRTWRRWTSRCCRCSYDAEAIGRMVSRLPGLAKTPRSMTQVPGRETRQGCQTRVDAVASLVGELQGEECACPIPSLSCWTRTMASAAAGTPSGLLGWQCICSDLPSVARRLNAPALLCWAPEFSPRCVWMRVAAGLLLGRLYLAKSQDGCNTTKCLRRPQAPAHRY